MIDPAYAAWQARRPKVPVTPEALDAWMASRPGAPVRPPIDWTAVLREMEGTRALQATAVAFATRLSGPGREIRIRQLAELLRLQPATVAADLPRWEVCAQLEAACPALVQAGHLLILKWLDAPLAKRGHIEERIRAGDYSPGGWCEW